MSARRSVFCFCISMADSSFEIVDCVVGGQCERGCGYSKGGHIPLTAFAFRHVRKAGQEILEKFENLLEVRFVEFEGAVENFSVVFVDFEMETIEV